MIKILHIITRLDEGGSAFNTIETVSRLSSSPYQVKLVSGRTNDPNQRIAQLLTERGVQPTFMNELRREFHPLLDVVAFFKLFLFIKKGRFDLVHTHSSKAGVLGRWAAWLAGVSVIIHTPHGHVFYGYFNQWITQIFIWMERLTAFITDKIIVLTEKGQQEHVDFKIADDEKFVVIPSGIDLTLKNSSFEEIQHLRDELKLSNQQQVIGCVGRLDLIKGQKYLIEAMPKILKKNPEVILLLVGDGDQRDLLKIQIKQFGLEDRVKMLGFRQDVHCLFELMDVVVVPSLNEGMGRVVLEAMYHGKAVVASRVGGIPDLICNQHNGWLVEPKDPTSLAQAIGALLSSPSQRKQFGDNAKTFVDDRFGLDRMVAYIKKLYAQLLKKKEE